MREEIIRESILTEDARIGNSSARKRTTPITGPREKDLQNEDTEKVIRITVSKNRQVCGNLK